MIFDSHAHYDDKQFDLDRNELLSSMKKNGIEKIVNIGANIESSKKCLELSERYSNVYAAVGVHPSEIECLNEEGMKWLKEATTHEKVVAIGEIGLDYYWEKDPVVRQQQKEWFLRQLQLARETNLPVVIHSRDSAEDTMKIMKEKAVGIPGVIHCYAYSTERALE